MWTKLECNHSKTKPKMREHYLAIGMFNGYNRYKMSVSRSKIRANSGDELSSTRFFFRTAHGKNLGAWWLALETPNFYCAPYNRKRASKRYNLQQIVVSQQGNCSNIVDGAKHEVICSWHIYRFYDINPVRMIAVLDKNRATPMRNKALVSTRMRLS